MPQFSRRGRMNEDIRRHLIDIIAGMKDPRLGEGLLSVLRVEAAPDLSSARVHVSVLGTSPDATAQTVAVLRRGAGHMRSELGRRMHIRRAPELLFVADEGSAYAAHIDHLLKDLEEP